MADYCYPNCDPHEGTICCPTCGRADKLALRSVKLMGFVGVRHSTSEEIARTLATGEPPNECR